MVVGKYGVIAVCGDKTKHDKFGEIVSLPPSTNGYKTNMYKNGQAFGNHEVLRNTLKKLTAVLTIRQSQ